MTATALVGKHIQAAGYSLGRDVEVDWLGLHTAEGSRDVGSLGHWFSGAPGCTNKASSNAGIDPAAVYSTFVTYNNTPWTNPPINRKTDTLEICAFKAWTRAQWLSHDEMLTRIAQWIAWRASVRGIPIRRLSAAQLRAGLKGVVDHYTINQVYGISTHTDVGAGFPWDVAIGRAQDIAKVGNTSKQVNVPLTPSGDRVLGLYDPPLRDLPGKHDVSAWQNVLRACGNDITIDGIYDRETADLTQVFKTHRGIREAGVGSLTWAAGRKEVHA